MTLLTFAQDMVGEVASTHEGYSVENCIHFQLDQALFMAKLELSLPSYPARPPSPPRGTTGSQSRLYFQEIPLFG